MTGGVVEQVPRYTMSHTDDGIQERLQLTVSLPGVTSAQEFEVCIQTDKFILRSPGRYNLVLPLHAPVEQKAESLQFVKKKQILKAELKVVSTAAATQNASDTVEQSNNNDNARPAANKSSKDRLQNKAAGLARRSKTAKRKAGTHVPAVQHRASAGNQDESDSSVPGFGSNSDTSPTFSSSPGVARGRRVNEDASPAHSEHASSSAECSCSDESSSSPQIKHWSQRQDSTYTAQDRAHDMDRSRPSMRLSEHLAWDGSDDDQDEDEDEAASIVDWLRRLQNSEVNPEDAYSAYELLMSASEGNVDEHCQTAADHLLDAQLCDSSAVSRLRTSVNLLDPPYALAVKSNLSSAFAKMVTERMSPEAVAAGNPAAGPAKSPQHARDLTALFKLLQALDHPAAELFQEAKPATQDETHRTAAQGQSGAAAADTDVKSQPQNSHHQTAKRGKKRAAASHPGYPPGTDSSPVSSHQADPQHHLPKQPQQQQQSQRQQQQSRGQQQQPDRQHQQHEEEAQGHQNQRGAEQTSTAASYGPEQQAEAKRQAKKEAALAWLDKAKAAAAAKNWTVALERAQKALSLNSAADFAQEVHALMSTYTRSQQMADANSSHSSNSPSQDRQFDRQHQQQDKTAPASGTQSSNDAAAEHDDSEAESTTYGQYSYTYADGHRSSNITDEKPWTPSDVDDADDDAEYHELEPESTLRRRYSALVETLHSWSSWLQRSAAPVWRRGQQAWLVLLDAAILGSTLLLAVYLTLCDVLPLLLYLIGRQRWCRQLQRGKQAGAWKATVWLNVISPGLGLLVLYSLYCFVTGGHLIWVVKAAALGAALPFCKTWGGIKLVASWLNFGWANLPIIVASRYLFKSWWPSLLSSSIAVWYVMGRGWLGLLCSILSAALTFFMTFETVSVPAAMILAYLAITKSFITGSMLKGAFVIVVGVIWWLWADNFKKLAMGEFEKQKRSSQSTAPPKPMSSARGSTDPQAEIKRILSTSCHYTVLEVDTTAEEEVIRRARRTKSLLVHPDKVGNLAGASDAFGKVTDAAEVLCDPYKRRQYDAEQAAAAYAKQAKSAQRNKPEEEDDPNVCWQRCSCCGELHRCIRTDKTVQKGRWCKDCNCFHPVKLGQGWVTRTGFMSMFGGGEYVVYACLPPDGAIYDVTESSACQGMLQCQAFRMLGPDCCKVWLTFGSPDQRREPGQRRQRERYEPPKEAAGGGRKNKRNKGRKRR